MRDLTPQRAAKLELVNHLRKSGLGLIEIRDLLKACGFLPKDALSALGPDQPLLADKEVKRSFWVDK